MTSAIPVDYHHPRHPHAFTPTAHPHYTPPRSSNSTSYYPSSSSTQHSSYWSTGASSSVATSYYPSPKSNPALTAAQFVTKHNPVRLHKRSRSGPEESEEMVDEGFFSGPGSPPPSDALFQIRASSKASKGKIKPLLKKVATSSRGNSLDLSRSDGGLPNGVGLGILDQQYDSSGLDDEIETAFPKNPRRRHHRNVSHGSTTSPLIIPGGTNTTATATPTQPFTHPKRQLPRRVYTPDLSGNESSDSSDEEERETRRIVLSGSSRSPSAMAGLTLNTQHSGRSTPMLPHMTTSMTDLHSHARTRTPSSNLTSPVSPVSPIDTLTPVDSTTALKPKSKARGRIHSSHKTPALREPSPSVAASVTAARLAWEAKEEKKEEKREQKRRKSEAKDEEKHRGRGNSSGSSNTWNTADEGYREKWEEKPMAGARGTGRKWGVPSHAKPPEPHHPKTHRGFKKRWLGFVVWVRIGMVRLGRKMGF